jgi:hypothetical protein
MAIPFKSLRFPRAPTQRWGIALGRTITRDNEMANWPYITQRVESYAEQFATLEGTALYVGYTDNHEDLRLFGTRPSPARTGPPDVPPGRQLFVKASYLLRF